MPVRKSIEPFVHFLRQFVPLTEEEVRKLLKPVLQIRNFPRKSYITKAGEVENYINFIVTGIIRKFHVAHEEEKVVQLAREGHLISCQESFFSGTESIYYLEAIEPTTLISVKREDLENLFRISHQFERLGRLVTIQMMVLKDNWQISLISHTPRERFFYFVENYPEILQRVPQKYIASYLNIQPETFSRFKHLMMSEYRNPYK